MNEKWTSLIYSISVLGTFIFLIVLIFNKPRRWTVNFIIKTIFTEKNQSYFEKYRLRSTIKKSQERLAEIEGQAKPHIPMTEGVRNIVIACIISFGLIVSAIIYAYSTRYQIEKFVRIDKWKGTYQKLEQAH